VAPSNASTSSSGQASAPPSSPDTSSPDTSSQGYGTKPAPPGPSTNFPVSPGVPGSG
jgi:hypothetical protein